MKHWTIRHRILASFGIILALMVIMASVAYSRLIAIRQQVENVEQHSLPGLYNATALMEAWLNDFLLTEEVVLQEDPVAGRRFETELQSNRAVLDKLSVEFERSEFTNADRESFVTFKNVRAVYTRLQDDILRATATTADSSRRAELLARLKAELGPQSKRGESVLQEIETMNRADADASAQNILGSIRTAELSVLISLIVTLALALVCGVSLFRTITRPLGSLNGAVERISQGDFTKRVTLYGTDELGVLGDRFNRMTDELTSLISQVQESGIQVNTSVIEIAATAKQQQATANEIAGTTTEIGATSREIAATSKELVKTMNGIASVADEAATLAGSGQTALTQMEATIRQVMDAGASVNGKLATLNEKAGDISQVVTTITKVADQTNLLSLNAAIEAEKAGEYGRGFAVVATEIRRLADQTAVATLDIDQMVKAIQSSVAAGVMSMDKFSEEVRRSMQAVHDVGGTLSQVIQQVQALAPRIEAVTEGVDAQATGAEQITEALAQLSEATRQTVQSLGESTRAVDNLNQVASGLRTGVSRFTLRAA
jgi:methyl-accepting chemotaxis protein WspA